MAKRPINIALQSAAQQLGRSASLVPRNKGQPRRNEARIVAVHLTHPQALAGMTKESRAVQRTRAPRGKKVIDRARRPIGDLGRGSKRAFFQQPESAR